MKLSPKALISDETLYREMKLRYGNYFRGGMGAEAVKDLLERVNLDDLATELRDQIRDGKGQKRQKAIKRLKVVAAFKASKNRPEWMILDAIPVIPPDLRPMVQLDGGRFATSDLNDLYRRVINRNNRLKRLLDLGAPEIIVNNEKRMLQEAVDALFDNGRRGRPVTGPGNRPLKSISDMLKGKQGRFRQNLLGKRVDYSGRSVIVVGPELKLHQCGLPKVMALELFKPFVMKRLVDLDQAQNIKSAKRMVDRQRPIVWDVLEEVIRDHPVLLNRAPTLHRLGIQAFEPVLVEGKAIRLHPLVCTAFNADFDGDQMAVHLPLSAEAQAEARILMLSVNNIKSPAHGRPLATPTQDMVMGVYYLTAQRDGVMGEGSAFASEKEAILAYDNRALDLQARIEVRLDRDISEEYVDAESGKTCYRDRHAGERLSTTVGRVTFNRSLPEDYPYMNREVDKKGIARIVEDCSNRYSTTQMAHILDEMKRLGFHYATRAGVTVSVYDVVIPPEKQGLLDEGDKKVAEIEDQYDRGLITHDERHRQIVDVWTETNEAVGEAMARNFDKFNPVYMMAYSGARGNIKQIRQLAGMRGLMANPKGEILDRPIKANFREGLSVLEYFISTHGARKGLADTALRTADSGYLTRRLVDVAQDVIVREADCETDQGVALPIADERGGDRVNHNLVGRCLLVDVVDAKSGEVLKAAGEYVDSDAEIESWKEAGVESVQVRAVMTCRAKYGVCQKCYGWDLASSRPVDIGTAVGIIAAQSIGEPGTQLTMRTFHTGGVAGEDITHGLPRVTELFEARRPKGQAILAEISGTLLVEDAEKVRKLVVHGENGHEKSYTVSRRARLRPGVVDGAEVVAGLQLTEGSVNPHDLLLLRGETDVLSYIVAEVQDVYASQGVDINDKHIEVIARQMMREADRAGRRSDRLPPRPARGPVRVRRRERACARRRRGAGAGRTGAAGHHQGIARHRQLPVRRIVPGDDARAHRRRDRGQGGQPPRPQGERHHREAHPGGHRHAALPWRAADLQGPVRGVEQRGGAWRAPRLRAGGAQGARGDAAVSPGSDRTGWAHARAGDRLLRGPRHVQPGVLRRRLGGPGHRGGRGRRGRLGPARRAAGRRSCRGHRRRGPLHGDHRHRHALPQQGARRQQVLPDARGPFRHRRAVQGRHEERQAVPEEGARRFGLLRPARETRRGIGFSGEGSTRTGRASRVCSGRPLLCARPERSGTRDRGPWGGAAAGVDTPGGVD